MRQPTLQEPPLDPEAAWLRDTYQGGGGRQLTARAVAAAVLLGVVMCLSNLYVFFKTGWSMGVTITPGNTTPLRVPMN